MLRHPDLLPPAHVERERGNQIPAAGVVAGVQTNDAVIRAFAGGARRGVVCVMAAALLAACGSSNGPRSSALAHLGTSPTGLPATRTSGPTAAQNKALAQAAADRVVTKVSLPPGAVEVKAQPIGLAGPALGLPLMSQVIDRVRYYHAPMSLSQAHAWFVKNPPPGFIQGGSASGSDAGGVPGYGLQYDPSSPTHEAGGGATLDVSLVAQASGTGIRVDGVAEWIDPAPVRDTSTGPAIRVTIAGGCPATDRDWNDVSNPGAPDLDHELLPAAAPAGGLSCTYSGMNGKTFSLTRSQKLNATQAAVAAEHLRALPLGSRGVGATNCPADDARATIVVFSYPGRADIDIWEHTSGCPSTGNGHIVSSIF